MNAAPGQGGGANLLSGIAAQHLAALSGVLVGQNNFNQAQMANLAAAGGIGLPNALNGGIANLAPQHSSLTVPGSVGVENKGAAVAATDIAMTSLPWPVISPIMNVPHFDLPSYRLVNLDVVPSRDPNGFDLPLADVTTLRFFFNLGVQHSRSLAATQLYQERLAHSGVSAAAPAPVTQTPSVSVTHVSQLAGLELLPTQLGGARTMDQYLSQLGIMGPQAQALFRQAQSQQLAQQVQFLASPSARLPDRASLIGSTIPLNSDVLSVTSQTPISVPTSSPTSQLIRQPILTNGAVCCTASPLNALKQVPSSNAAEQQAYYLQQALSAVANANNEKSEMRMQMLQQQGAALGLHSLVCSPSEEVLKPVAVGGAGCDSALSPRPPPVDPSPPRLIADAATSISDSTSSSTLVHQQAQTSPPSSRDQYASQNLIAVRPQSARDHEGPSANLSRPTPQSSAPATPVVTTDDVVPVSQTLFQVSEQHFTEAFNATRRKSTPNPIGIARNDYTNGSEEVTAGSSTVTAPVQGVERKDMDDKPALAPILMMTYLSNCMSNIKSTLNTNGLPVGLDANGRAVDYSSRPIDPIFQQARARMENAREFREMSPPRGVAQVSRVSAVDEGASFSPIGVALPTVSSTTIRAAPAPLPALGINRAVPDAIRPENSSEETEDDADASAQKRMRFNSEAE